jgi:hypothetical protein
VLAITRHVADPLMRRVGALPPVLGEEGDCVSMLAEFDPDRNITYAPVLTKPPKMFPTIRKYDSSVFTTTTLDMNWLLDEESCILQTNRMSSISMDTMSGDSDRGRVSTHLICLHLSSL